MKQIKTAFLMAYDYELLKNSIPLVYEDSDMIYLSLDKNRKTWSGNSFTIDDAFFDWIKTIDTQHKITIYEDEFYVEGIQPMECDTKQRRMTSKAMGEGGWYVQIDADEYFLSFKGFINQLRHIEMTYPETEKITVFANWITLYKTLDKGILYIDCGRTMELCHIATNNPNYAYSRTNSENRELLSTSIVLHESWARDENQLRTKLNNWSHKNDFDTNAYMQLWTSINDTNYQEIKDFHPLSPKMWKQLRLLKGTGIAEIIKDAQIKFKSKNRLWKFRLVNKRGGGRILGLLEKVGI
ncbi:MAG: hypothetical protein V4613_10555 [Bacteroidota bacterium]